MTTHYPLQLAETPERDGQITVTAPFNGEVIATVDCASANDIQMALQVAYGCYEDRDRWLPASQRIAVLSKAAELVAERADFLATEAAREGGKPLRDSQVEVARAIDGLRSCVECLRTEAGSEIPMGLNGASEHHLAVTRHEPIGVVVAISAFNHPLNLIVHQIGPAIAAGCPVIVKPAGDTPLSCFRLVEILHEAGLPKAWCQALMVRDVALAEKLVTDARVGFFSFIGSAKVGWMLRSQLAPGTRCALEHGGAAPLLVAPDADLDAAVASVAKGGFYHAGQVCVSVQRVYAHAQIIDELASRLAAEAGQLVVGDPTQAKTDIGPLIRSAEVQRVHEWVTEAVNQGATLLCGGKPLSDSCYAPTVLLNPDDQSRVSQQEIFGPVVCIYSYENLEQAIQRANAVPFSFQAAIFTRDLDTALLAYRKLNASAVMVNQNTAFRVDWMPFAGLRHSGLGVGGIPHTFRDMQVEKMLVIRSPSL